MKTPMSEEEQLEAKAASIIEKLDQEGVGLNKEEWLDLLYLVFHGVEIRLVAVLDELEAN